MTSGCLVSADWPAQLTEWELRDMNISAATVADSSRERKNMDIPAYGILLFLDSSITYCRARYSELMIDTCDWWDWETSKDMLTICILSSAMSCPEVLWLSVMKALTDWVWLQCCAAAPYIPTILGTGPIKVKSCDVETRKRKLFHEKGKTETRKEGVRGGAQTIEGWKAANQ